MKVSNAPPTCEKCGNENGTAKVNSQDVSKGRQHTFFEWIQLIATICIPIIIAIYSIIDNNKKESIAVADRRKDMEIANNSRAAEFEIAEQSRQKDRDLALDQQRENILLQYEALLENLILENGMTLNGTPTAKMVAISKTFNTLSKLDLRRKNTLLRTLYYFKLITLRENSDPYRDTSIIPLNLIDLSHTTLGTPRDTPADLPMHLFIDWYYIWLPYSTLINTSFRHTNPSCATFTSSKMESVDMSFVRPVSHNCFNNTVAEGQITFEGSKLMNASFYKAQLRFTSFINANLAFANMRELYCIHCTFRSAILFQADLSFSRIFVAFPFDSRRLSFDSTNLSQAVMHSGHFGSVSFFQSDWSNAQASQIVLSNCSFINANMKHCSLPKSNIRLSVFQNTSLFTIDLSDAKLNNVSFIDSDMRNANLSYVQCNYCDFINVTLVGAVLNNASIRYSTFHNCQIDEHQLGQAIDLFGSTLPNGTVVKSNE